MGNPTILTTYNTSMVNAQMCVKRVWEIAVRGVTVAIRRDYSGGTDSNT
ncbi:hypothetical protein [Thalassoroseus pseudoceratinae]|nr:hypothetical protein [Thalassoroseus pseudoceratinae]